MKRIAITMMGLALLSAAACSDEGDQNLAPSNDIEQGTDENNNNNNKKPGEDPEKPSEPARTVLDDRVVDYNEALRTASLKLTDRLPRLSDIIAVRDADDPKAAYEERLLQIASLV